MCKRLGERGGGAHFTSLIGVLYDMSEFHGKGVIIRGQGHDENGHHFITLTY